MTDAQYYNDQGYMQDDPQIYEGEVWAAEPVPVVSLQERAAPEYGACMTWLVPQAGIGLPIPIFNRRIKRSKGKLVITTLNAATSVVFNSKIDPLQGANPQGAAFVATGPLPDWESQQPLYAIAIGGTALVACWDEAYAER